MKKLLWLSLFGLMGCSHKESYDITCIADFSIIPYHTHSQGPVFTVTVTDETYLTFKDSDGHRQVFDKRYMCRIGD